MHNRSKLTVLLRVGVVALTMAMPRIAAAQHKDADAGKGKAPSGPLIGLLADEMDYAMRYLAMPDGTKPYFLAYTITDTQSTAISARLGALMSDSTSQQRML